MLSYERREEKSEPKLSTWTARIRAETSLWRQTMSKHFHYALFRGPVRNISRFPPGRIKRPGKELVEQFKPSLVSRRKQMEAAEGRGNSIEAECTFVYQTCLHFGPKGHRTDRFLFSMDTSQRNFEFEPLYSISTTKMSIDHPNSCASRIFETLHSVENLPMRMLQNLCKRSIKNSTVLFTF